MERDSDVISKATPTFSTPPDSNTTLPTLLDIDLQPKIKIAGCKPEIEITFERKEIATWFQRIPHIFDPARLEYNTADIARHWPITGTKNGGLKTGNRNNVWMKRDSDALLMAPHIFDLPLKLCCYLLPFQSYFYFRSLARHFELRMSDDVGQCGSVLFESGLVENVV
jgi:hypothetical protein